MCTFDSYGFVFGGVPTVGIRKKRGYKRNSLVQSSGHPSKGSEFRISGFKVSQGVVPDPLRLCTLGFGFVDHGKQHLIRVFGTQNPTTSSSIV